MKQTTKSPVGTSFHDTVINTTVNKLIKALGRPDYFSNDGKDKVNIEWRLETEDGYVVTVYDYKEYRPLDYDELVEFHIGGFNKAQTDKALIEICRELDNTKDNWDVVIDNYKGTVLSHYKRFSEWDEDHQSFINYLKKFYDAPIAKPIEVPEFQITEITTYKTKVWTIEAEDDTYWIRCQENDIYDDWQVESDDEGILDNESEIAKKLIAICEFESAIDV